VFGRVFNALCYSIFQNKKTSLLIVSHGVSWDTKIVRQILSFTHPYIHNTEALFCLCRRYTNNNKALYKKILKGKLDHLGTREKEIIEPVLLKYAHLFHHEETNDFKGTDVVEYQILTGDARPIRRPPYRVPYAQREEMRNQVEKMLDTGVIRDSNSPWSARAILVPKKSLDGTPNFRFCVDFRALNALTKFDTLYRFSRKRHQRCMSASSLPLWTVFVAIGK
jgi:hypothetical protein